MANYINKIKDENNIEYEINDTRLKRGGAKAFWFKTPSIDQEDLSFILCDLTGQTLEIPSGVDEGTLVSFKADFSASFIGTITGIDRETNQITVNTRNVVDRENFIPDYLGYDCGTNDEFEFIDVTNSYYIKTVENSNVAYYKYQESDTPTEINKTDWGYVWFPEYPSLGFLDIGESAIALNDSRANEICSFAEGNNTLADGRYSHTEGYGTQAAYSSHAEGYDTQAHGLYSHAEGLNTKALNPTSHAEGRGSIASGTGAHAEGQATIASGENSHAEGQASKAEGINSHAGGQSSSATGLRSFAHGLSCTAASADSFAMGAALTSSQQQGQFVRGIRNYPLGSNWVDIVGGGTLTGNRKNIYALDRDGNLYIRGSIYVNATNDQCTNGSIIPVIPQPPTDTDTYVLKYINGVFTWVLES